MTEFYIDHSFPEFDIAAAAAAATAAACPLFWHTQRGNDPPSAVLQKLKCSLSSPDVFRLVLFRIRRWVHTAVFSFECTETKYCFFFGGGGTAARRPRMRPGHLCGRLPPSRYVRLGVPLLGTCDAFILARTRDL